MEESAAEAANADHHERKEKIKIISVEIVSPPFCLDGNVGSFCENELVNDADERKPFQCDVCETRFSLKIQMKTHRLNEHENMNAFSCRFCDEILSSETNLEFHLQTHKEADCQLGKQLSENHLLCYSKSSLFSS